MQQQKLLSLIRQAIEDYNMIQDGDKIAVGVSGLGSKGQDYACDCERKI